jgi:DNA-binding IscR family transcriptional regulator
VVSKILKSLARHGLLVAVRGLRGGYSLSRPPDRISMADIVDALEEQPFGMTQCSAASGLCAREADCGVRAGWRTINGIVRQALEDVSVASMVQPVAGQQAVSGPQRTVGQQPVVLERASRRLVAGPKVAAAVAGKRRKQPTRMQP